MTSILASKTCIWSPGGDQDYLCRGRSCRNPSFKYSNLDSSSKELFYSKLQLLVSGRNQRAKTFGPVFSGTLDSDMDSDDSTDGEEENKYPKNEPELVGFEHKSFPDLLFHLFFVQPRYLR